ncbi:hypothetical protein IID10_16575 [candidate division KSB1 bacterium]|nr:hypothetical protein [candidate division KSB1 bacterium]
MRSTATCRILRRRINIEIYIHDILTIKKDPFPYDEALANCIGVILKDQLNVVGKKKLGGIAGTMVNKPNARFLTN